MFDGQLGDIWKQAQKIGERLKVRQAELAEKRVDVSVGGGLVTMQFDGQGKVLSLHIDPSLLHAQPARQALPQTDDATDDAHAPSPSDDATDDAHAITQQGQVQQGEVLRDLLLSAINEGRRRCQELAQAEFGPLADVYDAFQRQP